MRRFVSVGAALLALGSSASCSNSTTLLPGCGDSPRGQCVLEMALGDAFGCASLGDGTTWCWGRNDLGQLGYSTTTTCTVALPGGQTQALACHGFPYQVQGLTGALHLAAGDTFACALTGTDVRCWGANDTHQLGNSGTLPSMSPVQVQGLGAVLGLAAGARHVCALDGDTVRCWGANNARQLGTPLAGEQCATADGMVACASTPVTVALSGALELAAGSAHTCARTSDHRVLCWGDNSWGQLGAGAASTTALATPQVVLFGGAPLREVQSISARGEHTCALTTQGAVVCWGRNVDGELGVALSGATPAHCAGSCAPSAVQVPGYGPTIVPGPSDPDASVGFDAAFEAGPDDAGEGGATDASDEAPGPMDGGRPDVPVSAPDAGYDSRVDVGARDAGPALPLVRGLASGQGFTCAQLDDGTARCWGANDTAQVGSGRATVDSQPPGVVIAGPGAAVNNPLQGVTRIAAGSATACGLLGDRSLRCWGSNQAGALGTGTTGASEPSAPVPVSW